jgi:hypothetical protein
MKKLLAFVIVFLAFTSLHAENRYSFSITTADSSTTYADSLIDADSSSDIFISLEAFFSIDSLSSGAFQQGPVITVFDITNSDDSYSDYFFAGWEAIYEYRANIEVIGAAYAIFERSLYKNNDEDQQLNIILKDGYGAKLALRVKLFDDLGIDIATAQFEMDPSGNRSYTYQENSISLVWWF